MRSCSLAFVTIVAAGACWSAAGADVLSFSYSGWLIYGSGSLIGNDNGDGTYDITSGEMYVSEGLLGGVYSLYQNPNGRSTALSPSGYFMYDNQAAPGS